MRIDSISFFDHLATLMNSDPNTYELLGDIDLDMAIVMRRPDEDDFRVQLEFSGIECKTVAEIDEGAETATECWIDGSLEDWQGMFDDIAANGQATGEWTLNTITIMGDKIQLKAGDPMGWDKFHRFNQTLQDFVDAAAPALNKEASNVGS
ncbi:MAG: hypothetical protein KUG57_05585 [Ilumatobacteraceae bacterium]|nr:hypothetical protein [Ilumatobacteraceae bacterium]